MISPFSSILESVQQHTYCINLHGLFGLDRDTKHVFAPSMIGSIALSLYAEGHGDFSWTLGGSEMLFLLFSYRHLTLYFLLFLQLKKVVI